MNDTPGIFISPKMIKNGARNNYLPLYFGCLCNLRCVDEHSPGSELSTLDIVGRCASKEAKTSLSLASLLRCQGVRFTHCTALYCTHWLPLHLHQEPLFPLVLLNEKPLNYSKLLKPTPGTFIFSQERVSFVGVGTGCSLCLQLLTFRSPDCLQGQKPSLGA